jgi:glutamate-5-semialdehyde dehydrogenase
MTNIKSMMRKVKAASHSVSQISEDLRSQILNDLSAELLNNASRILEENQRDLAMMPESSPLYDRLQLTQERLEAISHDIAKIAVFPSPLQRVLTEKTLPNGLKLSKISVPLGVIGIIYESRPNVTIDVFSLCFKSGNACVLKGAKDAQHSNTVLVEIIQYVLAQHHITPDIIYLMPPERETVHELLNAVGIVDVCIPRGSQSLIDFVRDNSKVPVIETGAGVVHTYFDVSGDLTKGSGIINNAKTRRVSVCNALDTLIIHEKRLQDLPDLISKLAASEVEIYADSLSYGALVGHYPSHLLNEASLESFGREFLSYKISIKTVDSYQEAVSHIMNYTSGHSEAIIAEDPIAIQYFIENVDAAVVYVNASTAFTDGGEFGMGAEIGNSTQKLHARGPMGLEELTSYKWLVYGNGQVR